MKGEGNLEAKGRGGDAERESLGQRLKERNELIKKA